MMPADLLAASPAPFPLSAGEAEALTGGRWHGRTTDVVVRGATLDSRSVTQGCLYACIRGERVDGHDFAMSAVADGAVLVLATRPLAVLAPVLVVADVASALQALATCFRAQFTTTRWLAVCGANGKTTTKALLTAACAGSGRPVHATRGNLNNHLGVPLSILATPADTAFAVIEIGSNHPGEVAQLAPCVAPHVAVVTSIGPEHLEGFGDLLGVAREECSIFSALSALSALSAVSALSADGAAFLGLHGLRGHTDDAGMRAIVAVAQAAAGACSLVVLDDVEVATGCATLAIAGAVGELTVRLDTFDGSAELALMGAHNLANGALAFHAAVAAGVAPERALAGLSRAQPVAGRLVPKPLGAHLILDDTYNANPASVIAGLRVLAGCPGKQLAIIAAMGELGEGHAAGHQQIGAEAARLGIPLLIVAGRGGLAGAELLIASGAAGHDHEIVADRAAAIARARTRMAAGATTVLVKGSRSQGLEVVVEGLLAGGVGTC
jgi:UDP-N-acetylmuramoyl-tripeptide--D-alanyl-D-alanine ligase